MNSSVKQKDGASVWYPSHIITLLHRSASQQGRHHNSSFSLKLLWGCLAINNKLYKTDMLPFSLFWYFCFFPYPLICLEGKCCWNERDGFSKSPPLFLCCLRKQKTKILMGLKFLLRNLTQKLGDAAPRSPQWNKHTL